MRGEVVYIVLLTECVVQYKYLSVCRSYINDYHITPQTTPSHHQGFGCIVKSTIVRECNWLVTLVPLVHSYIDSHEQDGWFLLLLPRQNILNFYSIYDAENGKNNKKILSVIYIYYIRLSNYNRLYNKQIGKAWLHNNYQTLVLARWHTSYA